MRLTVAVPTFDRPDVIKISSGVLNRMPWLDQINLRVFDDASSLTMAELWQRYPSAEQVVKRPRNLGADDNCRQIMVDFLATSDECLLMLDSDLIVSDKMFDQLQSAMPHGDGVLSLYNSCRHRSQAVIVRGGHHFDLKQSVGAAGLVLTRERVAEIVDNIPAGKSFDWRASALLVDKGYQILVTRNSYLQHIGFDGYNCRDDFVDFGIDFDCDDETTNALLYQIIQEPFVKTILQLQRVDQELGLSIRHAGRIVERSIRRPIKKMIKTIVTKRSDRTRAAA